MNKKILIVHPSFEVIGGAEKIILQTAKKLSESDFYVSIASDFYKTKINFENCIALNYSGFHTSFFIWKKIITQLKKIIPEYDIVIAHNSPAQVWCSLAMKDIENKKLFWYCQEPSEFIYSDKIKIPLKINDFKTFFNPFKIIDKFIFHFLQDKVKEKHRILEKKSLERINKVFVNSRHTKEIFKKNYNIKADVLYQGVFIDNSLKEKKENIFLSVCRIEKKKNLEDGIRFFKLFKKNYKAEEFIYYIVGAGNYEQEIKKIINNENLSEHIKLTGFIKENELIDLYKRAKFYIDFSIDEPYGLTILEAMAHKCIVLASDEGGHKETVQHLETGFLCADLNKAFQFCLMCLEQPRLYEKIKENAYAYVSDEFSFDSFIKKLIKFF